MTNDTFQPFDRGVIITGNPTFGQWQSFYLDYKAQARRLPFILGDMLAYAEINFDDKASQALDGDDYCDCPVLNRGTAYNYKSVSLAWWPPERKIYDKPWSWYQATVNLPPKLQDQIMLEAISSGWNRDELRMAVGRLQAEHGISRKREQATYPGDREFDLMNENSQLREQISRMRELPTDLNDLTRPIAGWLQNQRTFNTVLIRRNGEVVIKP